MRNAEASLNDPANGCPCGVIQNGLTKLGSPLSGMPHASEAEYTPDACIPAHMDSE